MKKKSVFNLCYREFNVFKIEENLLSRSVLKNINLIPNKIFKFNLPEDEITIE